MTVKEELRRLNQKKEELEKDRSRITKRLEKELLPQETFLVGKKEEFSRRTSPLARILRAKSQEELAGIQQSIEAEKKYLKETEERLQETQAQIDARENDTTLYIQEQVRLMVPAFLKWVEENKEKIGYDITRSFYVAGETECRLGNHMYIYTGDIGIFEKGKETYQTPIVSSENFYFNKWCYDRSKTEGKETVQKTDWYAQYEKDFIKALLEELEESYNLGEDLRLTIQNPEFTLELV